MFTKEHRPVALPWATQDVTVDAPPPYGSQMSKVPIGADGKPYCVASPEPVDSDGRRTAHTLHVCPDYIPLEGEESCGSAAWLLDTDKVPACVEHCKRLVPHTARRGVVPTLPWALMRDSLRPKLPPAAVLVAEIVGGVAAHRLDSPWTVAVLAPPVLAAAAHNAVKNYLRKQKVDKGRIERGQTDGHHVRTIARRARVGAYMGAASGAWLSAAAAADPHSVAGKLVWAALIPGWAIGAATYWRHKDREAARRAEVAPEPVVLEVAEPEIAVDMLPIKVVEQWARRVGHATGAVPNTTLVEVKRLAGHGTNWSGVIESIPGTIDLSALSVHTHGRIASAYHATGADITIDAYPGDASRARIMLQPDNPLCRVQTWEGPADDTFITGLSTLGRYSDGDIAQYLWFNDGGPWHDLICGCTGSGKSELVAMLIATELNSHGLCLSWVADPCKGQSYGDLQDCVDWFARDLFETRFLLLGAVKEMMRRNNVFSQRRLKTWFACPEFPLLVITIDEAHEILKDPICLQLVERLANMARKVGIKLRIITQVPMVSQLGGSTPIKDALVAGQLIILRIGSAVSAQVAVGGAAEIAPHRLPKLWPEHSEAAGQTTAGLGFLLGSSSRNARLRTVWPGKEITAWLRHGRPATEIDAILSDPRVTKKHRAPEDLDWLRDELGPLTITPGVFSPEAQKVSGALWGGRQARNDALANAPINDADILPNDAAVLLIEAATAFEGGGDVAALRSAAAPAPTAVPNTPPTETTKGDKTKTLTRDLVVLAAVTKAGPDGRITREEIFTEMKRYPRPPADSTVRGVILDLTRAGVLISGGDIPSGTFAVGTKAKAQAKTIKAAADRVIDEALDGDPELINA